MAVTRYRFGSCWGSAVEGIMLGTNIGRLQSIYTTYKVEGTVGQSTFICFGEVSSNSMSYNMRKTGYGKALAAYITKEGLGVVTATPPAQNPQYPKGCTNVAYMWAVDWDAFKKWNNEHPSEILNE